MKAMVFDIQRYSIHDGRGIRTVVFFKGCNLRCAWCANPESQWGAPTLFYQRGRCLLCHTCVSACPHGEVTAQGDGTLAIHRDRCAGDLTWVDCCPADALTVKGRAMTVEDILAQIQRDRPFYGADGGATFSGGEPLLQAECVAGLARACKEAGISTALETAGDVDWENIRRVAPYIDQFLYDVKCADPALHRQWTGAGNRRILDNLRRLAAGGADVMVRTPLIPGVNDSVQQIDRIMALLRDMGVAKYSLLPFHQYGSGKYAACGLDYSLESLQPQGDAYVEMLMDRVRAAGFHTEF